MVKMKALIRIPQEDETLAAALCASFVTCRCSVEVQLCDTEAAALLANLKHDRSFHTGHMTMCFHHACAATYLMAETFGFFFSSYFNIFSEGKYFFG